MTALPHSLALGRGPLHDSVSTKPGNTLATVKDALGNLVARYRSDEVLTAMRHISAREAQFRPMPAWVRPELAAAYRAKGIEQLYSHQHAAAELAHLAKNVVVVTPTASGKTLCYNLPILNAVLENPDTRALYLFPTKALAQDQLPDGLARVARGVAVIGEHPGAVVESAGEVV